MSRLRACVIIPAFNEQEVIGACLRALALQEGLGPEEYEVILVLNACTDDTRRAALAAAGGTCLSLTVLDGPGGGPGPARRLGMELACSHLAADGLIASTDADTVVAPDWLQRQLEAVAAGADAVGGFIELDESDLDPYVLDQRRARAVERLAAVHAHTPGAEHHHFAGASMSLTVAAYRRLGGLEPLAALEDEALERALRREGLRIERLTSVRVLTSGRLVGRATRGLAHDLAALDASAPGRLSSPERRALVARLSGAGFVAAEEEADELLARAAGDAELLDSLVGRRLTGEPLAWITGSVSFCGVEVRVDPGVYFPRWQSEPLARRAVERLSAHGAAIDLCTGAGAIARILITGRPGARVVASDVDERAVACAAANGVEAYRGDLFAPLPRALEGRVDVVAGVVPYVPTPELPLLQRDTLAFESPLSYDGGRDGTEILRRVLTDSPRFLRHGGALLLELGGEQADALGDDLARLGYADVTVLVDEDGDVRGIEATLAEQR